MAGIRTVEAGHYRIPLTVALSDSTHGEIKALSSSRFVSTILMVEKALGIPTRSAGVEPRSARFS
jgi:hypothetical protein